MKQPVQYHILSVETLAGTIILTGLVLCVRLNFLLFHSLAELFSILVAYSIFVIAWNTRRFHENHFFLFLGIVYLFTGSLDLLHTLAYKGMGVFPTYDANLPTQLWIAARYLESGSLLLAPLFFTRKLPLCQVCSLYTLIFIGILASLFIWPLFPDCFIEGSGLTSFKVISEYLICLLLFAAASYIYRCRHQLPPTIIKLLLASVALTILAELSFTFYVSVYGLSNIVGHFCKLISFYLIYRALIQTGLSQPVELLFNQLAESKETYQDLYDSAPAAYFSVGTDGRILKINQSAAELLGYPPEELVGRKVLSLYAAGADGREKAQQIFKRFLAGTDTDSEELLMMRANGTPVWGSLTTKVLRDTAGAIVESRSIVTDISHKKKMQLALQQSEERLALASEYGGVGLWELDLIENQAWRSQKHAQIFGYDSPPPVWGQDVALRHIVPEDRDWFKHCMAEALRTGKLLLECRIAWQDQSIHHIKAEGRTVLDDNGRPVRMLGTVQDVSARKRAEAELQRSLQQLTSANEDLAQFSYVVAHDLKAPFRAVGNYSRFLKDDLAGQLSEQHQLYLTKMTAAANEADNLLEQMLLIAKMRHHELDLQPVEMKDFLEKLCISLDFSENVEVQIADNWPTINSDPQLLRQIFQNLMVNAVTYNQSEHKQVCIDWQKRTDGGIDCSVRDNGIGIAPEYQQKIFDMFERLHTLGEFPGSGVGLTIVKKAVEKLGGTIRLESTEGRGTTFHISLPSNQSHSSTTQESV